MRGAGSIVSVSVHSTAAGLTFRETDLRKSTAKAMTVTDTLHPVPIAVVGVSAIFPGSVSHTGFWRDILAGRDLLTEVPPTHWLVEDFYDPDPTRPDKTYVRRGGFIPDVDFDPMAWGVPPSTVPQTDTTQLLGLIVARQVLEDACGASYPTIDRSRVSCILGVTSGQELMGSMVSRLQRPVWVKALREEGLPESEIDRICNRISSQYTRWEEATFPGLLGNVVAGRIANRLDLGGTNCVTDAACASTFGAVSMAVNELSMGQSDMVIAGGCDTMNDIFMYVCFSKTPALSPTGDCRPFSDAADGTMLGEGLGMVALKRLADAERDGDRVYAVIHGVGTSSDGRSKSVYAPVPEGQAKALRRAYTAAGYGTETVELVEAHGTGTRAGDLAEFEGLRMVFDATGRSDRQWCALGSVKSQIGHTKSAAGAAGLIKAVLALHHKVLPPTIKVTRPNPKLAVERSPFYLNTVARPWIRDDAHPRRAGVSAFGFGGSNYHVAVEEYVGPAPKAHRLRTLESELVVLQGPDARTVALEARALADEADRCIHGAILGLTVYLARSTQTAYDPKAAVRAAVVTQGDAELSTKLRALADALDAGGRLPPRGVYAGHGAPEGSVGYVFPGQGSQYVGMGADVAMHLDVARAAWDQAATHAHAAGRTAPHTLVFPRPGFDDAAADAAREALTRTENAQPALGAASLALLRVMAAVGVTPAAVAGHSFGEVMALHAAEVLTADDALRVAAVRGAIMADTARGTEGAMLAVSASLPRVQSELARSGVGDVTVANHNAPDQVVLSGTRAGIEAIEVHLRTASLAVKRLEVATAFHSPIVAGACGPLMDALATVPMQRPTVPVYGNTLAEPYAVQDVAIRKTLAEQLAKPVRFVDTIEAMYAAGVRTFVEVGAGAALSGLVSATLGTRPHAAVPLDRRGGDGMTALHHALGRLVAAGVPMHLEALWTAYAPAHDPRTDVRPKVTLRINGANYGKPYPPPGGAASLPRPNPERLIEAPMTKPEAPTAPVASTPAAVPSDSHLAWVNAFQETQRQTAEAHTAFQRAMADSHTAYLRTAEASFATLGAMLGGAPAAMVIPAPVAMPVSVPVPPPIAVPTPGIVHAPVAVAAPPPVQSPAAAPVAVDVTAAMLSVVSLKTGYPEEMLGMAMELEADLGIDSIKRVEILAALRERVHGLPELDPTELGALRTLGQIVDRIQAGLPAVAQADARPTSAGPTVDLLAIMLEVVAQKTGYPREMIGMDMELEADLGIDSIKRVEILAAVRERVPGLPDMDPTELGSLRTVGQIVARMSSTAAVTATVTVSAPVAAHPPHEENLARRTALGRYVLRATPREAAGMVRPGLLDAKRLVVTDDGNGVAHALVEALRVRGVPAEVTDTVDERTDAVVYLGGLREITGMAEASGIVRDGFRAAKAIAGRPKALVTVQDTGGDFGTSGAGMRATLGALAGLAKTAAREWPEAMCRAVDLERGGRDPATLAKVLVGELLAGGPEFEVGLRADGLRVVPESVEADIGESASVLTRGDVVVASGGARGVTAVTMLALARATGCKLALLGRTAVEDESTVTRGVTGDAALKTAVMDDARRRGVALTPGELTRAVERVLAGREVQATLEAARAMGSEARYIAVDVTDATAVRAAVDTVRRTWGSVAAVVHGAGVLADRRIADKTLEQYDRVWDTKVLGFRALMEATAEDPLKAVCVFSSVAGRCGNPGQSDYAMANEALNKLAVAERVRRGDRVVVKSLGWGPWAGGMVTPALKGHFDRLGIPLIPLETGAGMLVRELSSDSGPDVEIVLGGDPRGGLDGTSTDGVQRLELRIDAEHYPAIASHEVRGVPVVPAVLAIEVFTRAARARRPDLVVRAVQSLQVLKGIRLPRFSEGGAERLIVESRPAGTNGVQLYAMSLSGIDGTRHYSARVEMGAVRSDAPLSVASIGALQPWSGAIYDGDALFHGPMFQAIQSVDGTGERGITGTLVGRRALGWPDTTWDTDSALLDGALQLAVLWTRRTLSGASLPTSLGSWVSYGDTPAAVHATAIGRALGRDRAVFDVTLADDKGATVGVLRELELHVLPPR